MLREYNFVSSHITSMTLILHLLWSTVRRKIRVTRTVLINPFSDLSVKVEQQPNVISMPSFSEQDQENCKRFWDAVVKMNAKLMEDWFPDIQGSLISKKRSYLVTRDEDGSVDLTDVQFVSLETAMEHVDTCVCLATFKTVKLS